MENVNTVEIIENAFATAHIETENLPWASFSVTVFKRGMPSQTVEGIESLKEAQEIAEFAIKP